MKKIIESIVFIALFMSSTCFSAEMTNESVREFIDALHAAEDANDIDAYASMLSDDVSISIYSTMLGRMQVLKPSRDEYLKTGKKASAAFETVSSNMSNLDIQINGSEANVSYDANMVMKMKGRLHSGKGKSKLKIKLIDGKLLVTEIFSMNELK